jgi:hypothetical protein
VVAVVEEVVLLTLLEVAVVLVGIELQRLFLFQLQQQ